MTENKYTNELIHESSPYLLEHAHNPVNWYPWGTKAFLKAKNENKPVIISIGYSACHWCHVMERESYSDAEVAGVMNQYFIAVKVDREEHPDIDQIYMKAAMLMEGNGGWPLNAFALPDGRPFFAGTYFPKKQWLELLDRVTQTYHKNYKNLERQAENLTKDINTPEKFSKASDSSVKSQTHVYHETFYQYQPIIDYHSGGFSSAPKFPLPVVWEFLLQYHYLTQEPKALQAVLTTLDKMAMGGIYDHLGGGFSRYSTDAHWRVPHFEKMLYDNAQLVSLYAHACMVTHKSLYADILTETLNFIKNEMTTPEGGFYSSLNADSEGKEGRFYVWSAREINQILGNTDSRIISDYYQVTINGNWETDENILYRNNSESDFALHHSIPEETFKKLLAESKQKMLEVRNKRIRPSTDDKILTSWNALMIKGYLDAYRALSQEDYLEAAIKNAEFLEKNMISKEEGLKRNYKNGTSTTPACLDDYAMLIQAYIELYQVTLNLHWLTLAKELSDYTLLHFQDKETGLFFYTSDQSEIRIARTLEISDHVMPSSNSVMARNLFILGEYFEEAKYTSLAKAMLNNLLNHLSEGSPYYANWASLLGLFISAPYEIALMGEEAMEMNRQMQRLYLPTSLFMGGCEENLPLLEKKKIKGPTRIYVCRNKTCKAPVEDVQKALTLIQI